LRQPVAGRGGRAMNTVERPLLSVRGLGKRFEARVACRDVAFELWPGEVLGIVGESGSGKTTLLNCIAGHVAPSEGEILYATRDGSLVDLACISEADRRRKLRDDLGFVHQNPRDGLRFGVSAGANIGEPLMNAGLRNYARIRQIAAEWLARVEIDPRRMDENPRRFSGGMQQRLQIARNLVTRPRLVLMDEPTGSLDVSVQARLLAHRLMVLQEGRIVETGLTDQVLDDPQEPYTQLLVSSVLQL
jgi:putative phosphonate transport system ATP-binding protein